MTADIEGILYALAAGVALVSTFVARWRKTNSENPWYIRLVAVFDATQVIDSTRSLADE